MMIKEVDRMKKRIISFIVAVAMLFSINVNSVFAAVNPFVDVAKGIFYYDPVMWAVENNITTGTTSNTFSPDASCTRGQIVTFLWRSEGSPSVEGVENPFTDVEEGEFYYDAVLWAVEKGITKGISETVFGCNDPCTRGQVATFLYRAKGTPEVKNTTNPFIDVPSSEFYYQPVLWALENQITTGISKNIFSPNASCTRGQIVTFLYRAYFEKVFTGSGDSVITGIELGAGDYYAEFMHKGSRNFIAKLYYGEKSYEYMALANKVGVCTGQVYLDDVRSAGGISDGWLEVKADGDWIIKIKRVSGTTTTNVSGTGQIVTGIFTATQNRTIFTLTHDGDRNFIVKVWEVGGKSYDYEVLTNEIGNYSGQVVETLTAGKNYFFEVNADGNWTIDLGQGDPVTNYQQPGFSGDDSGEAPDDTKYTYSEASELNGYATSAAKAINEALGLYNDVYGAGNYAYKKLYITQANTKINIAKMELEDALELIEDNQDIQITYKDYTSLTQLIQDSIDILDGILNKSVPDDDLDNFANETWQSAFDAQVLCIAFQSVTVEFLKVFTS